MQTFLPLPDFAESVRTLDMKRLGKQRVETYQIMQAVTGIRHIRGVEGQLERHEPKGWTRHPISLMWRKHLDHLLLYQMETTAEWLRRGYRDTCMAKTLRVFNAAVAEGIIPMLTVPPEWLGDPALHLSHRSNLLRKDPVRYRTFWPTDPDDLPYVWLGS